MKTGGLGGANTLTGLNFERKVDFQNLLKSLPGYELKKTKDQAGQGVYFQGLGVARCFRKHDLYQFLLESGVDWRNFISKKLLPDDALLVTLTDTLFIIEVKYQQVAGSVDEKLQTCAFKRQQYLKLLAPLNIKVEYVYVLNDWFKKKEYNDVLSYIASVHCHYRFNEIPLTWLGLPV
ncbi:MAG: hypothetical protein HQL13_04505 [Candidatus Omnitrophica bacterium]|nr:hypothetical protein [Candidatus Omnitrophota bacterium]